MRAFAQVGEMEQRSAHRGGVAGGELVRFWANFTRLAVDSRPRWTT